MFTVWGAVCVYLGPVYTRWNIKRMRRAAHPLESFACTFIKIGRRCAHCTWRTNLRPRVRVYVIHFSRGSLAALHRALLLRTVLGPRLDAIPSTPIGWTATVTSDKREIQRGDKNSIYRSLFHQSRATSTAFQFLWLCMHKCSFISRNYAYSTLAPPTATPISTFFAIY